MFLTLRRAIAAASVLLATGAGTVAFSAPAQALPIHCAAYLELQGYAPLTLAHITACNVGGVQGDFARCTNILLVSAVLPSVARDACRLALTA